MVLILDYKQPSMHFYDYTICMEAIIQKWRTLSDFKRK
jgi:hypothetical protein